MSEAGYAAPHIAVRVHKFAELLINDIQTVVAAQALLGESAMDVFTNLGVLYEGKPRPVPPVYELNEDRDNF